jgi:hypothetical protein
MHYRAAYAEGSISGNPLNRGFGEERTRIAADAAPAEGFDA